jgi:hypothetical protein
MTEADAVRAFDQVPLPSFAADSDVQLDGTDSYRVVMGRNREVGTTAVQYLDGRIDAGRDGDAPQVWIGDTGFSTDVARALASALIAAADELDTAVAR